MSFYKSINQKIFVIGALLLLTAFFTFRVSKAFTITTDGSETDVIPSDYCIYYSAFAERFVRPPFPENASADEQKNWYALKKTCGRDIIKLALAKWPTFDCKPADVDDDCWQKFIAMKDLSRIGIAEAIFDENHGGTLIKKYYSTDYEPDKIIVLYQKAIEEVSHVKTELAALTQDCEWKAFRFCELDFFLDDFCRWFIPFCRASLDKLPAVESFKENPDLFLSTADLLEFAVNFVSDDDKFNEVLNSLLELLQDPKAVEIRVFHGRYEGYDLVPRDIIFQRYCDRVRKVREKAVSKALCPTLVEGFFFNERQTERFEHGTLPRWGAKNSNQKDNFYVVFPKDGPIDNRPLYVVLHSAGHSSRTALDCTIEKGNHDVYRVPDGFYGLFLDCYDNRNTDWWWGGRQADQSEITETVADRATEELQPVEKRILDEIYWTIEKFKIDTNRVYLCGNSMGGSGTLGFGLSHGDLFAAIKANVPAGIWHAYDRLQLGLEDAPEGIADPPVCLDYSSPIDGWSLYHEKLFEGAEKRKYSYIAYWGDFGHENNDEKVAKYNDLFNTFDWTSIRKDQAYPVFTNSSVDSIIPWPDLLNDSSPGQRGAFYRWENLVDSSESFEILLRLTAAEEINSRIFDPPTTASADISIRRLQHFIVQPGTEITWVYGGESGTVIADKNGLITISDLKIGTEPMVLKISK